MRKVVNKRGSRQGGDVPAWIDRRVLLVLGLLATLVVAGYAAAPAWWAARGLPNGQAASDYAAANQGQLKNMAKAARAELVAQGHFQLTDTHAINTLVDGWSANNENATDYAAANLGQLKAVARLFYDALYLDYPWPAASPAANDYAVANIGQLKAVFAFQVGAFDSDADGLPDGWERKMFGDLDQGAGDDFDQDGLTDSQEFALGTSPKLQDTDADGMPDAWEQQYSLNPRDPADAGPAQGRVVRPEEPLLPQSEDYTHDYGNGPVLDQAAYSGAWGGYAEAMTAYHAIIQAADRMDVDKEGLSNLREYLAGTHPRVVSTDGDLYSDYEELAYGSDPLVAASIPPVRVEFSNAGPSLLKVSTFRAERSVGGEAVTVVGAPDTQFFSTAPGGVLTPGEITVTTDAVQHFATVWVFAPKGVAGGRNETVTTENNLTGNGNGNGNGNSQTGNSHTLSSYQWRGNLGLSLNPTMPGPSPESAAPPEGLVFTAHRKRKLSYSARQLVSPATEEYGDPSPIGYQWLKPAGGVPAYSDDGFNGDADPLGNNDDPGDPRDGITSATGALVPASPNEPGAHQVETGGARSVRIIGPYGTPTGLIGTYTATNAYSPPDTIESNGDGGFNPGQAVGKLEGVSYFQGASTNGWQGNGVGGVASYTVASTWSTATEQAPTVTYTNPETGDTGTSSATYQTQSASMEQVEVRLQTNKEVEVDKPLSAVFVLTKTTTPMEGGTTSSEFAAVLRLTISSGKISNVCEVLSGTLPAGVTTQGGVVSMRSPAPVAGNTVSLVLLPVQFEVTKWEPVITQPVEPYTTAWGNRNPPENQIDDEVFVAQPPSGKDTFVIKTEVKMKPLPIPAADLARIASEWKVAILQDVVALPTAECKTYVGQTGGAGSSVTTMAPVPGMDAVFFPDEEPDPDNHFPFKKFTTGSETLSLEYEDTPAPAAFGGVPIYKNGNTVNAAVALTNLKRDVTFVTWVYAEHVPTKSRQFLKWIRWQTSWDVDVDGNNFAPPKLTQKTYTFRKMDEGAGTGPVTPSFTKAQKSTQFVPAQ